MAKLAMTIIYNVLLFVYKKICYRDRYSSHYIQRFNMSASINLFGNGMIRLGRNIELAEMVDIQVHGEGKVEIGASTYMNRYCMISCHNYVSIGKGCMFGPSVKIFDNNHKFSKEKGVSTDLAVGEIIIGNNCWIASDVIILEGAKIGDNCVIGAGCIIDFEMPDSTIVRKKEMLDIQPIYK